MKFGVSCKSVYVCLGMGLALLSQPTAAVPITFDEFGPLPQATFGGIGIPNDEVAAGRQITFGQGADEVMVTVALSATQRFDNPPLTVDPNIDGLYIATAGSNFKGTGGPGGTPTEGALWNFNFYIEVSGAGSPVLTDFDIDLLYDFDPGENTTASQLGVVDIDTAIAADPSITDLLQDSQNLFFSSFSTPVPGVITPPPGSFDPDVNGEYTIAIRVSLDQFPVETVAIKVEVIPEPTTLALLLAGPLLLAGRYPSRLRR